LLSLSCSDVLLRLSILLSLHFTAALVALVSAEVAKSTEHLVVCGVSDGLVLDDVSGGDDRENVTGNLVGRCSRLELLSGSIVDQSSLRLAFTAWEQDHLGLVSLKTAHVELHLLRAGVGSPVINSDADGARELGGEASLLDFIEGEAASVSDLAGVLPGSRGNHWAKLLNGAREGGGRLCDSTLVSSKLLGWLIEVALCSAVPVLAQMDVRNGVVVLDHC
jgi:hypothetical protein